MLTFPHGYFILVHHWHTFSVRCCIQLMVRLQWPAENWPSGLVSCHSQLTCSLTNWVNTRIPCTWARNCTCIASDVLQFGCACQYLKGYSVVFYAKKVLRGLMYSNYFIFGKATTTKPSYIGCLRTPNFWCFLSQSINVLI